MAQTGFTPIQLYYSTTATNIPSAANLVNGELALNVADMKLYAKNGSGVVTLLADAGGLAVPNSLTMNNSGAGAASGTTFNGSAPVTLSYNTIGAPKADGTGASGTWGINITGNAATASLAAVATVANAVANSITFNTSGGASPGASFDGSAARAIDYSTVGAPKADGTGASGTWSINISGNAATATTATNLAGGALDRIPVQTSAGVTTFISAPTAPGRYLYWDNISGFQWLAGVGTGTVTSVDVSGGTTGLTFTGGPVTTFGTMTMSGVLDVDNGGTGLSATPANGEIDIGNGAGFTRTTLTAGTGISITNGPGAITIEAVSTITNGKLYFFSAF